MSDARVRGGSRWGWATLLLSGSVLVTASCREPTELTLTIRTTLPCTDAEHWKGVAVYVGKSGHDVETTSPTLVTQTCDADGKVGSLVVVPSKAKDGVFGLRVVAGVARNPEDCVDAEYAGCVVARRIVRFSPHASLELDVSLTGDCVDQACTAASTCQAGSCVDIKALAAASQPDPQPSEIEGPSVRCGDNGVFCATSGDVCCLAVDKAAGTTSGDCRPADECPPTNAVLNCDDDGDCPSPNLAVGLHGVCALSYTLAPDADVLKADSVALSSCRETHSSSLGGVVGLGLCEDRVSCADGQFPCVPTGSPGTPNPLPGYFWCRLSVP